MMKSKFNTILKFMPKSQALCFLEGLSSSECQYFQELAEKIVKDIENAPAIYETDGKGEDVKPILHYFWGNVDIFITEINPSSREYYGYMSLGLGYLEGGYIDLDYIFKTIPLLNLDLNFEPETIANYKRRLQGRLRP